MSTVIRLRGPQSITGHALHGRKLVRLVYLDETGRSKKEHDPYLGVVGVIVNADRQYRDIDLYLRDVYADIDPEFAGSRFVFHAKDIWHGSREFDRRNWTKNQRLALLKRLLAVPGKFHLPITYGFVDKQSIANRISGTNLKERALQLAYMQALHYNLRSVEYWMEHHSEDETAMLIIEHASKIENGISMMHGGYSHVGDEAEEFDGFKSRRIIDAPSIQRKQASIMLQLADHCAFILKRHVDGKTDVAEFVEMIAPQIVHERAPGEGMFITIKVDHLSPVFEGARVDQTPPQKNGRSRPRQASGRSQ